MTHAHHHHRSPLTVRHALRDPGQSWHHLVGLADRAVAHLVALAPELALGTLAVALVLTLAARLRTRRIVRGGRLVWSGTTDQDGLAVAKGDLVPDDWSSWSEPVWVVARSGDDAAVTSHQFDEGLEGWSHGVSSSFDPAQVSLQVASFTDRGVYRPGDTVHVQLTARERSLKGLTVPARRKLDWVFKDPEGQEIAKLHVFCDGKEVQTTPLYAEESVEQGDLIRRSTDAAKQLLLGWLP